MQKQWEKKKKKRREQFQCKSCNKPIKIGVVGEILKERFFG